MAFWSKWIGQAAEIDMLRRNLLFAKKENTEVLRMLNKADSRAESLDKKLEAERKAHNQALRRFADQLSRFNKLPEHFVKDVTPVKDTPPDTAELDKITWAAEEMQKFDLDRGVDKPIEEYIEVIKEEPNHFII